MSSKSSLERRGLIVYVVLAYLLSWLCLVPIILCRSRGIAIVGPILSGLLFASSFGPLISAFVVTRWQESTAGVHALLAQGLRWRVRPLWYLVALLAPPFLMLLANVLYAIIGGVLVFPKPLVWLVVPLNFVLVFLLGGPLGEEFGCVVTHCLGYKPSMALFVQVSFWVHSGRCGTYRSSLLQGRHNPSFQSSYDVSNMFYTVKYTPKVSQYRLLGIGEHHSILSDFIRALYWVRSDQRIDVVSACF